MQQINQLKNENNELKTNMQYAGLNGLNLLEMTKAERDRLQTHLSQGSIKTMQPDLSKTRGSERRLGSAKSSRSNKSKSSIKSRRSSQKSRQEWDLNGHRIKRSATKSSMKRKTNGGSKASIRSTRQASFSKSRQSLSRISQRSKSKSIISGRSGSVSQKSRTRRASLNKPGNFGQSNTASA